MSTSSWDPRTRVPISSWVSPYHNDLRILDLSSYSRFLYFCQLHPYQRSCQMRLSGCGTLKPFFLARVFPVVSQVHTSVWHFHLSLCASVASLLSRESNLENFHHSMIFFRRLTPTAGQEVKYWNVKMIVAFYSVNCLVPWIVGRIGKVGRDVVKPLISITDRDIKLFLAWSSSPLMIIKSKYQPIVILGG